MIDLIDLWKSYGDNPVLRGLNLHVNEGETHVIIGRSGAGKSQILKHIMGLVRPDRGRVVVGGVDITSLSERKLGRVRMRFGFLFQEAALFDSMTVGENVAFPLREHTNLSESEIREKVREKLALVRLYDVGHLMPSELSGGMRKRVGLARAIAADPIIILYDEPTTGLDPITCHVIDDLIVNMKEQLGVASVVVSHDMNGAFRIADRIAMLHRGKIIEEGTPEEIRRSTNRILIQFIEGDANAEW